jgi:hypothetical protein
MSTSTTGKRRNGRPPHQPSAETRSIVKRLAAQGNSRDDIAVAMGITRPTLLKHYYPELVDGYALGKVANTKRLHEAAARGSVAAMIWLDKTRYGINEPVHVGKKVEEAQTAAVAENGTEWAGLLQ